MSDENESVSPDLIIDVETWPRTITLKRPVKKGSEQVTVLTFQEGYLGLIKGIKLSNEMPTDVVMKIAANLCGEPVEVIERLSPEDAGEAMNIALRFFARCLATTKKRSTS